MASTATLSARLEALKEAYHSGLLTVTHNGKTATYRSRAEMLGIINDLEGEIAGASSTRRTRLAYQRSKGL
jgi:hypothetical protein